MILPHIVQKIYEPHQQLENNESVMMLKILKVVKQLWMERVFVLKVIFFIVIAGLMFDSAVSMLYFWPSEGLFNEPPMWFTNAMVFVISRILDTVRYVVVTCPAFVLFLLAPFYKELVDRIRKIWRKIKVEATGLYETARYEFWL
jgi:hypothetical protein